MLKFLTEHLDQQWVTQFFAELIITLFGSYLLFSWLLDRVSQRREAKRMREHNQIRDQSLQLCSNRLHRVGDQVRLEMVNLSSWQIERIIPYRSLRISFERHLKVKRQAVLHNVEGSLHLGKEGVGVTDESSLLCFTDPVEAKKLSSYLYDLLALCRDDLIYYFGPQCELLISLHYEKVYGGGNERARIFIFDRHSTQAVYNHMLTDREKLFSTVQPMIYGAQHHLNRLIVMAEVFAQYLSQKEGSAKIGVWPYITPARYDAIQFIQSSQNDLISP